MPRPSDELQRLAILHRYSILDTPQEAQYDRIVWLAAHHFHAPIAVITFVDEDRLWFKSTWGIEVDEIERAQAFCHYTIQADDIFEVPNAALDQRFATTPMVCGGPRFRYYAGAPITATEGWRLGSVAIIDMMPRPPMGPDDRRLLCELAAIVAEGLEIRLAAGDVRAEIEERRRAQAAAERSNLAKTRFLAAASHDLRQPMQSLLLFLGILRQRVRDPQSATVVVSAYSACQSMKGLLDDLLDVSRLEAGLVRSQAVPIEIDGLLARLAQEYRRRAAAHKLQLRHVRSRLTVISDPQLLERILRNLIENALRYTATGGVVIGCRRSKGQAAIQVVDTGSGMSGADIETIFDDFVQISNPERDRSKGLGLGLAIVRRLADLLGHRIEVRSKIGRGSAFTVKLPLAPRPADPARSEQQNPAVNLSGRMLVIDDERSVREALGIALSEWGLDVVTAEDAEDAVASLHGQVPDAILADYRLRGGTTGVEAVTRLRDHYHAAIPTLLLTGDTSPDRLAEARSSGFTLMHKPVMADELRRMVETVLVARTAEPGKEQKRAEPAGRAGSE